MKLLSLSLLLFSLHSHAMKIVIQTEQIDTQVAAQIKGRLIQAYYLPKSRVEIIGVKNCELNDQYALEWCLKKNGDLIELPKKNNSLIKTSLLVFKRIRND